MGEVIEQTAKDWAGNIRGYAFAWGVPSLAIVAGSYMDAPVRTLVWSAALLWMGTACLVNARRCRRTHCRFTGPFYLALIIPVLLQGYGLVSFGPYAWWIIGGAALFGGKLIWWSTETVWGKFSSSQ